MAGDDTRLVQNSKDRFRIQFVDYRYDPTTKTISRQAVDLKSATDVLIKWKLNGVTQVDLAMVPDADQVNFKGWAYHDFADTTLFEPGEARMRLWYTDISGKAHKSRSEIIIPVEPAVP